MRFKPTVWFKSYVLHSYQREDNGLFITIYVDDIIIVSNDHEWIRNVKTELAKDFDIKDKILAKLGY